MNIKRNPFSFSVWAQGKKTEAIGREEGFAEAWGGCTGKGPTPPTSPIH